MMSLSSCSWRETTKIGRGEHRKGVRDSSQVLKVWEFAQKYMCRLAAWGVPPGASAEAVVLRGCKMQCWFWVF